MNSFDFDLDLRKQSKKLRTFNISTWYYFEERQVEFQWQEMKMLQFILQRMDKEELDSMMLIIEGNLIVLLYMISLSKIPKPSI